MVVPVRALLAAVVLGFATLAYADTSAWSAPADCPAPRLTDLSAAERQALDSGEISVAVRAVNGGWAATVSPRRTQSDAQADAQSDAQSDDGRVLKSADCAELNRAVRVRLSLLNVEPPPGPPVVAPASIPLPAASTPPPPLEPSPAAAATWPPAPSASAASAATSTPAIHAETRPAAPPPLEVTHLPVAATARDQASRDATRPAADRHPWQGVLAPAFSAGFEGTKPLTLGGLLTVGAWRSRFGVRATASLREPMGSVQLARGLRTKFTLLSLGVDGCLRTAEAPWLGSVCAGPFLQLLQASAEGLTTPNPGARWLFGAETTVTAHWRVMKHVGVFAALRAELRNRLEFRVRPYLEPIFEYPPFGAQLLLGPEFWL